jgi:hypothetical protein
MSVQPVPERARRVVLQHTKCGAYYTVAVMTSRPEEWPTHKCSKTNKAEPFDWWTEVPAIQVRELPPEEPSQPVTDPYPYLKVIG